MYVLSMYALGVNSYLEVQGGQDCRLFLEAQGHQGDQ